MNPTGWDQGSWIKSRSTPCQQRCLEVSDGEVQEPSPQSPVSTSISSSSAAEKLKGTQLTSDKSLSDSKFAGGHNSARCLWAVPAGTFFKTRVRAVRGARYNGPHSISTAAKKHREPGVQWLAFCPLAVVPKKDTDYRTSPAPAGQGASASWAVTRVTVHRGVSRHEKGVHIQ